VPTLRSPVRFVLLRHASEIPRLTNTGRWAALALEGTEVVDYGVAGCTLDATALVGAGAFVLFPSPHPPAATPRPSRVVVPDGTWAQARRMVQRVPALRALPRLSLPPSPPAGRLRRPTVPGGMSTIEAIAGALRLLGEPEVAARLDSLHALGCERTLRLKGSWTGAAGPAAPPRRPC
jgi:tRNA-uridine aminocarboxypropyltransferase